MKFIFIRIFFYFKMENVYIILNEKFNEILEIMYELNIENTNFK